MLNRSKKYVNEAYMVAAHFLLKTRMSILIELKGKSIGSANHNFILIRIILKSVIVIDNQVNLKLQYYWKA